MDSLLQLMHDTMNKLHGIILGSELLLTGDCTPEEVEILHKAIQKNGKELQAVLDAYYVAQKA